MKRLPTTPQDHRWRRMQALVDAVPKRPWIRIDHPRWSMVKHHSDGRRDFVSPLPCPYDYGCVPGYESGDGDEMDAVVLGVQGRLAELVQVPVVGWVAFWDQGRADPKLICSPRPLTPGQVAGLRYFFRAYALFKRMLSRARGISAPTLYLGLMIDAP